MKARLPRALREFKFDRLFEVELNNFDIERVLPDLFFIIVSRGRQRGTTQNDARDLRRYLAVLATNPSVVGADEAETQRLLDRWLRSTVISTARATKRLTSEQIDYILPLSIAAYKPGFPTITSRQRGIPGFLYGAMLGAVETDDRAIAEGHLLATFMKAFGRGVAIGPAPDFSPSYDGMPDLDIHARLSLAYLEGFEPVMASTRARTREASPALPAQARGLGHRLLAYIEGYGDRLPASILARGFLALASFELFVYSAKLFAATVDLLSGPTVPRAMADLAPTPPELYSDFTGIRAGISDELARACTDRDLEGLTHFFDAVIRLKTIERYGRRNPSLTDRLEQSGTDTPAYLVALHSLQDEPRLEVYAEVELEQIRDLTAEAAGEDNIAAVTSEFEALRRSWADALSATVSVIADAQRSVYLTNLTKWFSNAGGLRREQGFLVGNASGPRNWRYAMSDELLLAIVQLAFVDPGFPGRRRSGRMPLKDLLTYLEDRYGVIVDRPPSFLDSSAARAAARENLAAFKRKLRQMGYFDDLSDDFAAQYLTAHA